MLLKPLLIFKKILFFMFYKLDLTIITRVNRYH